MKKIAKTLLSEERFWEIIECSNKGVDLEKELEKLIEDELFGFRYWWEHYHALSYRQDLWAVAYVVLGGCSDDGFDYFRYWLISRGKSVFMETMENVDSLCDEFDKEDVEYPEAELLSYVVCDVYENRFGTDFYDAMNDYDMGEMVDRTFLEMDFDWDEDNEESIRKICPKTFDKWWGNDKF
jgi:hypothetical protein